MEIEFWSFHEAIVKNSTFNIFLLHRILCFLDLDIFPPLSSNFSTGTLPLMQFFGTQKKRVNEKPRYRRTKLVLKWENGNFDFPKSPFFTKNCSFFSLFFYAILHPKVMSCQLWQQNCSFK